MVFANQEMQLFLSSLVTNPALVVKNFHYRPMRKNVFLVDDDRDDREIFIEALAEVDDSFSCFTAENGEDAIKKLHASAIIPDYIFLDLNMPRMNGRECLVEIKSIKQLKEIPVIIYTTSSLQKEKEELEKLGAWMFLTKPSNFSDLCHSLKQVLITKVDGQNKLQPA